MGMRYCISIITLTQAQIEMKNTQYKIQHLLAYGQVSGEAVTIFRLEGSIIIDSEIALINGTRIAFDAARGYLACGQSAHSPATLKSYFTAAKSAWLNGKSAIFVTG